MRRLAGFLAMVLTACGSDGDKDPGDPGGTAGANTAAGSGTESGGSSGSAAGGSPASGGKTSQGGKANGGAGGSVTPPDTKWVNVTNNLTTLAAGKRDVTFVSAEPNTERVLAGIGDAGMFVTVDSGKTWTKLGSGAGSAALAHRPSSIQYDPDHPGVFWESGIYGDGIFHTADDGVTFQRLGDISHNDQVSVDLTDPDRKVLLAGAHEAVQKLYKSTNGGMTWEDIGPALPAGSSYSTVPLVIDAQNYLVGSALGPGTWGVYRTSDAGKTWKSVSAEGAGGWPLRASDGTIYWSLVLDKGFIVSTDDGATWKKVADGPVYPYSGGPLELPDGRILTLGSTHILATSDKGQTWKEVGEALPFPGGNCHTYGFTYSVATKTFYINHNDCSGVLTSDAVWTSGFDYETE